MSEVATVGSVLNRADYSKDEQADIHTVAGIHAKHFSGEVPSPYFQLVPYRRPRNVIRWVTDAVTREAFATARCPNVRDLESVSFDALPMGGLCRNEVIDMLTVISRYSRARADRAVGHGRLDDLTSLVLGEWVEWARQFARYGNTDWSQVRLEAEARAKYANELANSGLFKSAWVFLHGAEGNRINLFIRLKRILLRDGIPRVRNWEQKICSRDLFTHLDALCESLMRQLVEILFLAFRDDETGIDMFCEAAAQTPIPEAFQRSVASGSGRVLLEALQRSRNYVDPRSPAPQVVRYLVRDENQSLQIWSTQLRVRMRAESGGGIDEFFLRPEQSEVFQVWAELHWLIVYLAHAKTMTNQAVSLSGLGGDIAVLGMLKVDTALFGSLLEGLIYGIHVRLDRLEEGISDRFQAGNDGRASSGRWETRHKSRGAFVEDTVRILKEINHICGELVTRARKYDIEEAKRKMEEGLRAFHVGTAELLQSFLDSGAFVGTREQRAFLESWAEEARAPVAAREEAARVDAVPEERRIEPPQSQREGEAAMERTQQEAARVATERLAAREAARRGVPAPGSAAASAGGVPEEEMELLAEMRVDEVTGEMRWERYVPFEKAQGSGDAAGVRGETREEGEKEEGTPTADPKVEAARLEAHRKARAESLRDDFRVTASRIIVGWRLSGRSAEGPVPFEFRPQDKGLMARAVIVLIEQVKNIFDPHRVRKWRTSEDRRNIAEEDFIVLALAAHEHFRGHLLARKRLDGRVVSVEDFFGIFELIVGEELGRDYRIRDDLYKKMERLLRDYYLDLTRLEDVLESLGRKGDERFEIMRESLRREFEEMLHANLAQERSQAPGVSSAPPVSPPENPLRRDKPIVNPGSHGVFADKATSVEQSSGRHLVPGEC